MAEHDWKIDLGDPQIWMRRIASAKAYRDAKAAEYQWERAHEAYMGRILAESPSQDTVTVNWPYGFIANMLPSLYYSQPRIYVRPTQEAYRKAASLMEPLINYVFRELRVQREFRRAILSMLIYGHGWAKLGWASKYGEVPGPDMRPDTQMPLSPGKRPSVRNIRFKPGRPFLYAVNPYMMLVDPRAPTWEEARWVVQSIFRPYAYLMEDPFIENKPKISPGYRLTSEGDVEPYRDRRYDQPAHRGEDLCLCYEIWDLDSRRVRMICEGSDDWQRDEDWPYPFMAGLPFYLLSAGDSLNDLYSMSPLVTWLAQNEELSKIRTMQLDALYRARGKILVQQGAIDDEELVRLRDPLEDVVIVKDVTKVVPFRTLTLDPNAYICEDRVKRDIMDISGLSELQYGAIPGGRVTATVGMIAQKATLTRIRRFVDNIRDWIVDIAGDLAGLLANRMPEPQHVAITTDTGTDWIEIMRSDIEGEFLFDIDVGEMAPLSREARQKEAIDLVSLLGQAPEVRRRRLLADALEAFGRNQIDAYLYPEAGPPADPQYENEIMIQGIEVLPNPQEDFALHLQVHAQFMESQLFASVTGDVPAIKNVFAAHVQRTMAMAREMGVLQATPEAPAAAGPAMPPGAAALEQGRSLGVATAPVVPGTTEGA